MIGQTRDDPDDRFAVGIVEDSGDGTAIVKEAKRRGTFEGVQVHEGDCIMKVRSLVRDESDSQRRTFYDQGTGSNVVFVNSTELRHHGFVMAELEPKIPLPSGKDAITDAAWQDLLGTADGHECSSEDDEVDHRLDSEDSDADDDDDDDDRMYVHSKRLELLQQDEAIALDICW